MVDPPAFAIVTRWDSLFDDLESQLEEGLDAERVDLLAEEERLRISRLALRDRLVALVTGADEPERRDDPIRLLLRGGEPLLLRPRAIGRDWIAGDASESRRRPSCVVPLEAVAAVEPTVAQVVVSREPGRGEPVAALSARLGLGFVLRDLCRRRVSIELSTASLGTLHGTIDRVGRDHLDLAEHEHGSSRRAVTVRRTLLIAFGDILRISH